MNEYERIYERIQTGEQVGEERASKGRGGFDLMIRFNDLNRPLSSPLIFTTCLHFNRFIL